MQQRTPGPSLSDAIPVARQAFYDKIKPHNLTPLWEVLKGLVPREPTSKAVAHAWHYATVRPALLEAGGLLTAEGSSEESPAIFARG